MSSFNPCPVPHRSLINIQAEGGASHQGHKLTWESTVYIRYVIVKSNSSDWGQAEQHVPCKALFSVFLFFIHVIENQYVSAYYIGYLTSYKISNQLNCTNTGRAGQVRDHWRVWEKWASIWAWMDYAWKPYWEHQCSFNSSPNLKRTFYLSRVKVVKHH